MNMGIFSHCAIDTITLDGNTFEQVGGPACYGSLTARQFKMDVNLATKFGKDFPAHDYLTKNNIKFADTALSPDKLTTRFNIIINGDDRDLFLQNLCDPLEYTHFNADGIIITPIFNEISIDTFEKIKKDSNFILLDPQGFLRRKNTNDSNKIYLEKTLDLDLNGISAIKAGIDELDALVGSHDISSMQTLQNQNIEYVLCTNKANISLLVKDKMYSLRLPNKEIHDTTGIGDIFCSTFCCTMLKEKDFLWAFCFAAGSAQAALDSKDVGLNKIPKKGQIEINASYFYNTVKFHTV
jgi:sugar/nucleoside kinase (ribokinase family)